MHVGLDEAKWSVLPGEENKGHTPANMVVRIYQILMRTGEKHHKKLTMHLWADHGGRALPKEIEDKVVIEPWKYLESDRAAIITTLEKYGGAGKTPCMMGGGANSLPITATMKPLALGAGRRQISQRAGRHALPVGKQRPGQTPDHVIRRRGIFLEPGNTRSCKEDPLGEHLRQRIEQEMRSWQLIFPDATPAAINADRGPEVQTGRLLWPTLGRQTGRPHDELCRAQKIALMRISAHVILISACLFAGTSAMAADVAQSSEVHEGVFPFYPYAARYDIWNFTPLDQGGRLIQLQLIGSERDVDVVKAIRSPGFFAPGAIPSGGTRSKNRSRKECLAQPLVFPPLLRPPILPHWRQDLPARHLEFVRKWAAENPVPPNLTEYFASKNTTGATCRWPGGCKTSPGAISWAGTAIRAAEKRELFDLAQTHAHVLLEYFGKALQRKQPPVPRRLRHALRRAALSRHPRGRRLKERAFAILNHHLDPAFYEDGNSVELVPGYYPFFASIFRDAFLFAAPIMSLRRRAARSGSDNSITTWARSRSRTDGCLRSTIPPRATLRFPSACWPTCSACLIPVLRRYRIGSPASDQAVMRDASAPPPLTFSSMPAPDPGALAWRQARLSPLVLGQGARH